MRTHKYVNVQMLLHCLFFLLFFFTVISCSNESPENKVPAEKKQLPPLPVFNSDSAFSYLKIQCDFGPRVPNTQAHGACGDYLIKKMNQWCNDVIVQSDRLTTFDGTIIRFRNIIATFNPQAKRRILLFAHWDTRPWADQDSKDNNKPALGADDGASGIAVLMEVARQLKQMPPAIGVDIAFFDAEDWGKEGGGPGSEDSYALGTQYWSKNPHVPNYKAEYGILLDMVGARDARFRKEGLSKQEASFVLDRVWSIAQQLGYSSYFLYEESGWVTDDHVYVNRMQIPSIDIINTNPGSRTGFASHWHTHSDNLDLIDQNSLKAVGQTLLGVIFYPEGTF